MVLDSQCEDNLDTIRFVVHSIMRFAHERHASASIPHIPFEVTIPSSGKPAFVVRDFGTGLPEHELRASFGTISTAATAPLQYAPVFYVTSHTETDMRSAYIALNIDEQTSSVTVLESESKPDFMHTGLNIAMFVNQQDIARFEQEVIAEAMKFNIILVKDGTVMQHYAQHAMSPLLTN